MLAGDGADGEMEVDAVNRRGQAVHCIVALTPLPVDGRDAEGVIIRMDVAADGQASREGKDG